MKVLFQVALTTLLLYNMVACAPKKVEDLQPVETTIISVNGEEIEMILVEGGTFTMGCTAEQEGECEENETPHEESVEDFYIGKYEVTQRLWNAVMGETFLCYNMSSDSCPVEKVSWRQAQEFIAKLNTLTNGAFRLPTDTEWEYAARGGNRSQGYKYSGSNNVDEVAWYVGNYEKDTPTIIKATHSVGQKKPNELGIYDMSGNVWEWCENFYDKEYWLNGKQIHEGWPYPGVFPSFRRVLRGGSWGGSAQGCRVSYIDYDIETYFDEYGGFRLAMNKE